MNAAILDTDTLSEVIKQRDPTVARKASEYLQTHEQFAFSIFTRFEIVRGYQEKRAIRQLARFNTLCQHSLLLPLSDAVFERAADLWALAHRHGHPHGDADVLIAATALENGMELATGNTAHFAWVPRLILTDWRQS